MQILVKLLATNGKSILPATISRNNMDVQRSKAVITPDKDKTSTKSKNEGNCLIAQKTIKNDRTHTSSTIKFNEETNNKKVKIDATLHLRY